MASTLVRQGASVHVVDKSRGPGGRCSIRRAVIDGEEIRWSHGAIKLDIDHNIVNAFAHPHDAIRHLLHHIPTTWQWEAASIAVDSTSVTVTSDNGDSIQAKKCIITIPGPQVRLLSGATRYLTEHQRELLQSITYSPRYAILALVDTIVDDRSRDIEDRRIHDVTPMGRIPITLVTTATWAKEALEQNVQDLQVYWRRRLESEGMQVYALDVHRWRYAVPEARASVPLIVAADRLLVAGDGWAGMPWQELSLQSFSS